MISEKTIICENVDTIVSCYAPKSNNLYPWMEDLNIDSHLIGDAISPRTVEEAVLEGFKSVWLAPIRRARANSVTSQERMGGQI